MTQVHIGKKIREVFDESSLTVVDFAKQINLSRDGVYKIFGKRFIDTDQLLKISKVLGYDFFAYFSGSLSKTKEPEQKFGFATKDEVENLTKVVHALALEIKKLREELPSSKPKRVANKPKK
jgi:hypothetical protein